MKFEQECIPVGCVTSATVAVCWGWGGACSQEEGVWSRGVPAPRGCVCSWGVPAPGGVCSQGGVCFRGGHLVPGGSGPGGVVSQHALRQTPPVNRMTDGCKKHNLCNFIADDKYEERNHTTTSFLLDRQGSEDEINLEPRMHSRFVLLACWLHAVVSHGEGLPIPLDADSPSPGYEPPPWMQTPHPFYRKTDACENITLPQNSFGVGKDDCPENNVETIKS